MNFWQYVYCLIPPFLSYILFITVYNSHLLSLWQRNGWFVNLILRFLILGNIILQNFKMSFEQRPVELSMESVNNYFKSLTMEQQSFKGR